MSEAGSASLSLRSQVASSPARPPSSASGPKGWILGRRLCHEDLVFVQFDRPQSEGNDCHLSAGH